MISVVPHWNVLIQQENDMVLKWMSKITLPYIGIWAVLDLVLATVSRGSAIYALFMWICTVALWVFVAGIVGLWDAKSA
jgi:hypothetical protein